MPHTYQILLSWDKGSTFAERMSAKLLGLEGYSDIEPQSPAGGPDGTKDILCKLKKKTYVAGCFFPNGQKSIGEISKKFGHDYGGMINYNADGFIFITNQKLSPGERKQLQARHPHSKILDLERICHLLDSPTGYGVRLEFLGIELTKEEQLSFIDGHLRIETEFAKLNKKLDMVSRVTSASLGLISESGRIGNEYHITLPIAGRPTVSTLTVEDIFSIHIACMYAERTIYKDSWGCYRSVEVWIGNALGPADTPIFVPPAPAKVPGLMHELLSWWRRAYEIAVFSSEDDQFTTIAEFHSRFLDIHPFLDGNGRVARILTSLQLLSLTKKKIMLQEVKSWSGYYEALSEASNSRNYQPLVECLKALGD